MKEELKKSVVKGKLVEPLKPSSGSEKQDDDLKKEKDSSKKKNK